MKKKKKKKFSRQTAINKEPAADHVDSATFLPPHEPTDRYTLYLPLETTLHLLVQNEASASRGTLCVVKVSSHTDDLPTKIPVPRYQNTKSQSYLLDGQLDKEARVILLSPYGSPGVLYVLLLVFGSLLTVFAMCPFPCS